MVHNHYFSLRHIGILLVLISLAGCQTRLGQQPASLSPSGRQAPSVPLYVLAASLGDGREWRPYPLLADINGDGNLDIVATHRRPLHMNALHIWFGTGQGIFNDTQQTWHSPGYSGLAAGDINHDGHLDLVAASHFSRVHTLLGDGHGSFTDTVMATREGYTTAKLTDINGDGHLDVILLGWQKAGIEIYLGNGAGQWVLMTRLMEGMIGRDLAVADINEDGKADIVAITANRGVMVYFQESPHTWDARSTDFFSATHEFRSVALGDVNQDGHLDIALNGGFQGPSAPNGPDVYVGDGKGGWAPSTSGLKVLQPPSAWGIALGDVDRDGNVDIIAGGNMTGVIHDTAYGLFLFTGDGQGNWTLQTNSGLPSTGLFLPYGIALEDLNHDGCLDIVVAHGDTQTTGGYLTVWLNQRDVSS